MKAFFFFLAICFGAIANGQNSTKLISRPYSDIEFYMDTVIAESENYGILHYHRVSRNIFRNYFCQDDGAIFNDSVNDFSRLIFRGGYSYFNVPTVPLTNIFIIEDKKLILGLSSYNESPANIIIYSFTGKILFKRRLSTYELQLNKRKLKKIINIYPEFKDCIERQPFVFKDGDTYHIEITNCISKVIADSFFNWVSNETFFLGSAIPISEPSRRGYQYSKIRRYFSKSNPLRDIIMVGNVPYLLVLNDFEGKPVYIPLIANCNILEELKE